MTGSWEVDIGVYKITYRASHFFVVSFPFPEVYIPGLIWSTQLITTAGIVALVGINTF